MDIKNLSEELETSSEICSAIKYMYEIPQPNNTFLDMSRLLLDHFQEQGRILSYEKLSLEEGQWASYLMFVLIFSHDHPVVCSVPLVRE